MWLHQHGNKVSAASLVIYIIIYISDDDITYDL